MNMESQMTSTSRLVLGLLLAACAGCVPDLTSWAEDGPSVTRNYSEPAAGDQVLLAEVDLKVGELQVGPGSQSEAYDLELRYNEAMFSPRVDFERQDGKARLDIALEGGGRTSFRKMGNSLIRLRVNPEVPLELTANTGVGSNTVDLSGLSLQQLRLQAGVGDTKVTMLHANRIHCDRVTIAAGVGGFELTGLGNFGFRSFDFRGGVGESRLDFSGDWNEIGEVSVEVGVGQVELRIPRSIGAEIRMNKGLFSDASLPEFRKEGNTYFSENLDRVDKVVRMRVQAGIGGVNVRWM